MTSNTPIPNGSSGPDWEVFIGSKGRSDDGQKKVANLTRIEYTAGVSSWNSR